MALILNIETSSPKCSVCLAVDGKTIAVRESEQEQNHASLLTVFIDELFKETGKAMQELSAVAISAGPGSYTGLRIGTSTAKGICYALEVPLIALDSLEILANGYLDSNPHIINDLLCPIIDARRMEVYYALFSAEMKPIISSMNTIVDTTFLSDYKDRIIHFFGSGAEKTKQTILFANNCAFLSLFPSSSYMSVLSHKAYVEKTFANTAYFEPNYIKPFYDTQTLKRD